jgi:SAM-dependent methyltransferase
MSPCHLCGFPRPEPLRPEGGPFGLVSSDVQCVAGTAEFAVCPNCAAVQKPTTPEWQAMAERIYANYDINHQAEGAEPMIFDSAKGHGPRSSILLRHFLERFPLAESGRLLDIGCANGKLLESFHGLRPSWRLSGAEIRDTWAATVLALPGVERFYSGPDPAYEGRFDVISLSHVLEHIPEPVAFLERIAGHLAEGGRLLVALPDLRQNPIDLVIADHCTHFDERSLGDVLAGAGLEVALLSASWLPKELVAVASRGKRVPPRGPAPHAYADAKQRCLFYFKLIDGVREAARKAMEGSRNFGVMGSSIAACWLAQELGGGVAFFVDEDPRRVGGQLMDRPILGFAQLAPGATVFIPMSVPVAERIIGRWGHLPVAFRFLEWNRPG